MNELPEDTMNDLSVAAACPLDRATNMIPKYIYARSRHLPSFVRTLCWNHEGWVVGGGAKYLIGLTRDYKDWDIIIPSHKWMDVPPIIPHKTESNTFGGYKVNIEKCSVDVWCEDLGHFIMGVNGGYDIVAVQPRTQQVVVGTKK